MTGYIWIAIRDDELYKILKHQSVDEKRTLIEITEEAIKFYLENKDK